MAARFVRSTSRSVSRSFSRKRDDDFQTEDGNFDDESGSAPARGRARNIRAQPPGSDMESSGGLGKRSMSIKSLKNVGKAHHVFMYKIIVDSVDNVPPSAGTIVVTCEHRNENLSTTPVPAVAGKIEIKQTLERETTLFTDGGEAAAGQFKEKLFKFAVRGGNADGKTIAKIHLNLADYASVPSGKRKIGAKLSNNTSTLVLIIETTFLGSGKKAGPGSIASSSGGSFRLPGRSKSRSVVRGQKAASTANDGRMDDFADLGMDNDEYDIDNTSRGGGGGGGRGGGGNVSEAQEYKILKKRVAELERVNRELREQIAQEDEFGGGGGGGGGAGMMDDVDSISDTAVLRAKIDEFKNKNSKVKDTAFQEVVQELMKTKVKLALTAQDNDQLKYQLSRK